MTLFRRVKSFFKDPEYFVKRFGVRVCPDLVPDKWFLQVHYLKSMGCKLDLNNPLTFTEKLQWLKLHDRNPLYTILVDKYLMKEWVAERIGEQYVIPTLAVFQRVEDICINELPDQFVLKCNHDSGSVVICHDKRHFDLGEAKEKLRKALNYNYYLDCREWPYKNVKRCIIAEPFLISDSACSLSDFKFFCFNGGPRYCQLISDRETTMTVDYYDMNWQLQPFSLVGYPHSSKQSQKPDNFDEMVMLARKVAKGIPFVRVDFYNTNQGVRIGEITFFPTGGYGELSPKEWNRIMGDQLVVGVEREVCNI